MIRFSVKTGRAIVVEEPEETQLTIDAYEEWLTGFIDGVPIPDDEWFIGTIDLRDVVTIIEKDRDSP